ncbi:MAG TPA: molybdopterin-dependent oxidoreductase [Bryobacteraceae bacterium]|nr:molybdopterin-dependent oxidoreductase [Bryobacteraceae bacterium]
MMYRRTFLEIGGAAAAAAAVGCGRKPSTGTRTVKTYCEMCFWKCGVLATVRDGDVVGLAGNPDHPLSRGRLCARGFGGIAALHDPDRLKTPLIRQGARGEERFQTASWSAALDHSAEALDRVRRERGPEAVAGIIHGQTAPHLHHLLHAFGTPNIAEPAYAECRGPRDAGFQLTFGIPVGSPECTDIANARVLVLLGYHLGENMHNTQAQDFAAALSKGAKVIVVDPRFSTAASKSDWYLPIRPGTDIALLLAWIHILLAENLYDREYVDRYAIGLKELRESVAEATPQWAAGVADVFEDDIISSAHAMAAAKPAALVHPGRHAGWYGDDVQRSRAIAILNALLGSWGRNGGFLPPVSPTVPKYPLPPIRESSKPSVDGTGTTYRFATMKRATGMVEGTESAKPYPVKAWIVGGSNPLQSIPNTAQTHRAINRLDFLMVVDILPAEIASYADVVLPECTYLERYDDLHVGAFREGFVALRQPAIEPMYDSKPGWWIARELGRRLGLSAWFPWANYEDYLGKRLEGFGVTIDEMKQRGVILAGGKSAEIPLDYNFETPSGKIELYSKQLADAGFDPIPRYTAHPQPGPGQFRLVFGRSPLHTFGRTQNNPALAGIQPENEVWINSRAAAERGIEPGSRVLLVNQDGASAGPARARVTERIRPDCVYMVHGFGHSARGMRFARGKGASDSDLVTRYAVDPIMGGTGKFVNFVRVEKV